MYKNKLLLLVLALIIFAQFTNSQNNTNSPYTRFGYGDISDTNNGEQRAMGGVSIGSRFNTSINTVNPASYSSVDSMTFMFDIGASALVSHFSDLNKGKTTLNANLEYITMQFPLAKWLGFSAGLLPYSFAGYNFSSKDTTFLKTDAQKQDTIANTKTFVGSGGFSQVYMGLSANLFKHVSLGVNAYYMYGTIDNYRDITFAGTTTNPITSTSSTQRNSITANNFRFRLGAQFYNTFAKKHDVTLGLIYEPKIKLNGGFSQITSGVPNDTIDSSHPNNPNYIAYGFELPSLYGIGFNYMYDKKLSIGIDYSLQQWKNIDFFWNPATGKNSEDLNNRSKLAVGVEYQPNPKGRNFSDRIRYRGGFNVSDSYYNVDGITQPKNYGITCGLGLPLYNKVSNSISMLNASFEYGKIGSTATLREDYFKFTLNVTFNEHWFFKRKL
ncbi:MAG: hypothetical protein Q8904_12855 [Bacteroidota bacterium]|nr:hypothetical protein [Bacteroidota bacterium]